MTVKFAVQQFIRTHARSLPMRTASRLAQNFLRFTHNEDYGDHSFNGEGFALDVFAKWSGGRSTNVWDVGAHMGGWSTAALERLPHAHINSFEIIPAIAAQIPSHPRRTVHPFGLSDQAGESEVTFNPHQTMMNTMNRLPSCLNDPGFHEATMVPCVLQTIDRMTETLGKPDFVKIDAEGHDVAVLRGARELIASGDGPAMFQIEYGNTYLASGSNLLQVYDLLPGYLIGRLYPKHVDFKKYQYTDDHFRMGNLIATRDAELAEMLG